VDLEGYAYDISILLRMWGTQFILSATSVTISNIYIAEKKYIACPSPKVTLTLVSEVPLVVATEQRRRRERDPLTVKHRGKGTAIFTGTSFIERL
jgi:hypothetical protein